MEILKALNLVLKLEHRKALKLVEKKVVMMADASEIDLGIQTVEGWVVKLVYLMDHSLDVSLAGMRVT